MSFSEKVTQKPSSLVSIIDAIENWDGIMHVHCVTSCGDGFWEKMISGQSYYNTTDRCFYEQKVDECKCQFDEYTDRCYCDD